MLKHLMPAFIKDRYLDIKKRLDRLELSVKSLETALDSLIVDPKYAAADDIGLNGQIQRKRAFADIIGAMRAEAIVETGTWIGNSAGYMSTTTRLPVHSCELNPRFHAIARMRLTGLPNIHLELSDSRSFLEKFARGDLTGKRVFFYLDAHWYDDLPVVKELEIVAGAWRQFVVMIDDFGVPDDPGYGFDNYGPGKKLDVALVEPAAARFNLDIFFPAAGSQEESGARRGYVVLAPKGDLSAALSRLPSLRLSPSAIAR